LLMLTHPHS